MKLFFSLAIVFQASAGLNFSPVLFGTLFSYVRSEGMGYNKDNFVLYIRTERCSHDKNWMDGNAM